MLIIANLFLILAGPTTPPATPAGGPALTPAAASSRAVAATAEKPVADEGPKLKLGLQVRPRLEKAFSGNLGAKPGNPNYRLTQRSRATIGGSWANYRAHVSVQDVRTWASETSTLGDFSADFIDFHEAWGEGRWETENIGTFGVRAGRQEVKIDGQRLIGSVNWAQQGRSFDGLKLFHELVGSHQATVFAALVPDGGQHFLTLAHIQFELGPVLLSSPWILQTNAGIAKRDRGDRQQDWSRGTAGVYAKMGGDLSWRTEAYAQWTEDTFAAMFGGRIGYKFNDFFKEELWFDFLTGEPDPGGTIRTFDTLFATNHKFYGFMDRYLNIPVHTKNGGLIDVAVKHTGEIGPGKLHGAAHLFIIPMENSDGNQGPSGFELDLVYTWPVHKVLKLQGGVGLFVDLGDFAQGRNNVIHDWFFLQLLVNV